MSTGVIGFWNKVNKDGSPWNGIPCWVWLGARIPQGYGSSRRLDERKSAGAHRIAYEELRGKIPAGLEIDHLCRNRLCVNPDHMELVTHRENLRRGDSPSALCARKTRCKRGHPFDSKNTYRRPNGDRVCRACRKEYK